MPELAAGRIQIVACLAAAEALDDLGPIEGALVCRVAPDEAMVLVGDRAVDGCVEAVTARARELDPDALVLDATDGFAAWTLTGEGVREVFARLSALEVEEGGVVQGDVAGVPVRVLSEAGRLDLIVPSMWERYLRERILERCADLGVREVGEPATWAPTGGGA